MDPIHFFQFHPRDPIKIKVRFDQFEILNQIRRGVSSDKRAKENGKEACTRSQFEDVG